MIDHGIGYIYQPEISGLGPQQNTEALAVSNALVPGDTGLPTMDEMRSILHRLEEPQLFKQLLRRYSTDGKEHIAEVIGSLPEDERTDVLRNIINEPELEYDHVQDALRGIPQSEVSGPLFQIAAETLNLQSDLQEALTGHFDTEGMAMIRQALSLDGENGEKNGSNIFPVGDTMRMLSKMLLYNGLAGSKEITAEQVIPILLSILHHERNETMFGNPSVLLPTIGTEVESGHRHHAALQVIGGLRMPLYREVTGTDLWEVANGFSYSHDTQSALLHELMMAGFYPTNGSFNVHKGHPISMHINLGTNGGLTAEMLAAYYDEMYTLNDALTLAHVSPERLDKRKTRTALTIDTAQSSRKTEQAHPGECVRVEMRVNEYKGPQSERLLRQAQYMSAAVFAHVRQSERLPISSQEEGLAALWAHYQQTLAELVPHAYLGSNIFDNLPAHALTLAEECTTPQLINQVTQHFTREAERIVWSSL